jgi:hypothetical protein
VSFEVSLARGADAAKAAEKPVPRSANCGSIPAVTTRLFVDADDPVVTGLVMALLRLEIPGRFRRFG